MSAKPSGAPAKSGDFIELLLAAGKVTATQVEQARDLAKTKGGDIALRLIELGAAEGDVTQALAQAHGLMVARPGWIEFAVQHPYRNLITEEFARRVRAAPLGYFDGKLYIAFAHPGGVHEAARSGTIEPHVGVLASERQIASVIYATFTMPSRPGNSGPHPRAPGSSSSGFGSSPSTNPNAKRATSNPSGKIAAAPGPPPRPGRQMTNPGSAAPSTNPGARPITDPSGHARFNDPSGSIRLNDPSANIRLTDPSGTVRTLSDRALSDRALSDPTGNVALQLDVAAPSSIPVHPPRSSPASDPSMRIPTGTNPGIEVGALRREQTNPGGVPRPRTKSLPDIQTTASLLSQLVVVEDEKHSDTTAGRAAVTVTIVLVSVVVGVLAGWPAISGFLARGADTDDAEALVKSGQLVEARAIYARAVRETRNEKDRAAVARRVADLSLLIAREAAMKAEEDTKAAIGLTPEKDARLLLDQAGRIQQALQELQSVQRDDSAATAADVPTFKKEAAPAPASAPSVPASAPSGDHPTGASETL